MSHFGMKAYFDAVSSEMFVPNAIGIGEMTKSLPRTPMDAAANVALVDSAG